MSDIGPLTFLPSDAAPNGLLGYSEKFVAIGKPWHGFIPVAPAQVLLLDGEERLAGMAMPSGYLQDSKIEAPEFLTINEARKRFGDYLINQVLSECRRRNAQLPASIITYRAQHPSDLR